MTDSLARLGPQQEGAVCRQADATLGVICPGDGVLIHGGFYMVFPAQGGQGFVLCYHCLHQMLDWAERRGADSSYWEEVRPGSSYYPLDGQSRGKSWRKVKPGRPALEDAGLPSAHIIGWPTENGAGTFADPAVQRELTALALEEVRRLDWVCFSNPDDPYNGKIYWDSLIERRFPFLDGARLARLFDSYDGDWREIIPAYLDGAGR